MLTIRRDSLATANYGFLLELLVLVSDPVAPAPVGVVIGSLVEKVLLGLSLVMVVLVPRSVLYWSVVPPSCLLQPASINAAPRIRIAFFMVQSFGYVVFPVHCFSVESKLDAPINCTNPVKHSFD